MTLRDLISMQSILKSGLILGVLGIGAVVYNSITKEESLGENFQKQEILTEISDENYRVKLIDEFGKGTERELRISLELDRETNILYFGNYTQDYSKQNWPKSEERIPIYAKHTTINPELSKVFILHPGEVRVSGLEQKAYLVPQYSWDQNLQPYEEHEEAQELIESGEKIIDWATEKIPIPYFQDFFSDWFESSINSKEEREIKRANELAERIKSGYTATVIPSYIKGKLLGSTETAREYKIIFDVKEDQRNIPLYLVTQIALGNPGKAPFGSFHYKFGRLEEIVIKFNLDGKKEVNLQGKLSNGKIAIACGKNIYTTNPNGSGLESISEFGEGGYEEVSWSPDGERIAFVYYESGSYNNKKIGIMDKNGKRKEIIITGNDVRGISPHWSPNGKKIVFYSGRGNKEDIFMFDLKSREISNITNSGKIYEGYPLWSPDGEGIILGKHTESWGAGLEVWIMNLSGGGMRTLFSEDVVSYVQDLSRDGERIIYKTAEIENHEAKIFNLRTNEKIKLPTSSNFTHSYSFSPDGEKIVYISKQRELWVIDSNGSNKRRILKFDSNCHGTSWQPIIN